MSRIRAIEIKSSGPRPERAVLLSLMLAASLGVSTAAADVDSLVLSPAGLRGWHRAQVSTATVADANANFQTDGQILVHWPQDDILDTGETSTGDFHELDTPGIHTAYATFAGDADHDPIRSITCTWNVAG